MTSDSGLILVGELDERLGFGKLIKQLLADLRGKNFCTNAESWKTARRVVARFYNKRGIAEQQSKKASRR